MVNVSCGSGIGDDLAWIAEDDGVWRHVEVNISTGGDERIVADCNFAYDDGVRADPDTVFKCRRAFMFASAGGPYGDALANVYIFSDNSERADDDASEVADVEAIPNAGCGGDVESILETIVLVHRAIVEVGEEAKGPFAPTVVSYLAHVIREAKTWDRQVSCDECTHSRSTVISVEVGANCLP